MTTFKIEQFDDLPVMVHSIDLAGKITFVNKRWLEVLEYHKEEVLGHPSTKFLSEESRKFAEEITLPLYFEKQILKDVPYELITKSQKKVYVLLSAMGIRTPEGHERSLAMLTNVSSLVTSENYSNYQNGWGLPSDRINERVIEVRKSRRLTQEDMARILGMSPRTYQRIEHGDSKISVDQLLMLTSKFNLSLGQFFTHKNIFKARRELDILVVDDENQIIELISKHMKDFGCKVLKAYDGDQALQTLKTQHVDVVITNLHMPKCDGHELIKRIRELKLNKTPEIFICTATPTHKIKNGFDINQSHIFDKPVDFEKLKFAIYNSQFIDV